MGPSSPWGHEAPLVLEWTKQARLLRERAGALRAGRARRRCETGSAGCRWGPPARTMWWTLSDCRPSWGCRPLRACCAPSPADTELREPQLSRRQAPGRESATTAQRRSRPRWWRRKGGWSIELEGQLSRGRAAHLLADADGRILAQPLCGCRRLHGGAPKPLR